MRQHSRHRRRECWRQRRWIASRITRPIRMLVAEHARLRHLASADREAILTGWRAALDFVGPGIPEIEMNAARASGSLYAIVACRREYTFSSFCRSAQTRRRRRALYALMGAQLRQGR